MKKRLSFITLFVLLFAGIQASSYSKDNLLSFQKDTIKPSCFTFFDFYAPSCKSGNCNNLTIQFMDSSYHEKFSYFWDFGDSTNSYEKNPVHTYKYAGNYYVTLRTLSKDSCISKYGKLVQVGMKDCNTDFGYNIVPCDSMNSDSSIKCAPVVQFYGKFSGTNGTYYWDFGDGTTSNLLNPVHKFPNTTNNWLVSFTAKSLDTYCYGSISNWVYVKGNNEEELVANFENYEINCDSCARKNLVSFVNLSQGEVDSVYWKFGDGTYSFETNPVHSYEKPGSYTVCLSIVNKLGEYSFSCKDIVVGNVTGLCQAAFTQYRLSCSDSMMYFPDTAVNCRENKIQFYNISKGDMVSCVWDFGDGEISTEFSPEHSYASTEKNYGVTLTIYTLDSCISSIMDSVIFVKSSCNTAFKYYFPKCGKCGPNSISFVDASINAWSYNWAFGDGNYSNEQNPMHQYSKPGLYYVCLETYSMDGCTGIYCQAIQVGSIVDSTCTPYFSWNELAIDCNSYLADCISNGIGVGFENLSTGNYTYTHWVFGDGNCSTLENPMHVYDIAGKYPVTLVISGENCQGTYTSWINVGRSDSMDCSANFYAYSDSFARECANCKSIVLKDLSKNAVSWFWEFGNGDTSSLQNPNHTFFTDNADSMYWVSLTIETNSGCVKRISKYFEPKANIWHVMSEATTIPSQTKTSISETIDLFPNPAQSQVRIKLPETLLGSVQLQIADLTGRTVYSKKLNASELIDNSIELNIGHIGNGNYICKLISNQKTFKGKLIIKK